MKPASLGRALGSSVAVVAILNTASALSMPVPALAPHAWRIALWLLLLSCHATLYWNGERLRARFGVHAYLIVQGLTLFAIALSRAPMPITLALFVAATVESVILAGSRWGTTRITTGSIAIFVVACLLTSTLYFASTAGLVLALTGTVAHAFSGFARPRSGPANERPPVELEILSDTVPGLTVRETEVLRELVRGARNSEIASTLGITERTVKSHLKSLYQKFGVDSRSAAVSKALRDGLV
jgi:DNA-binding CsgD family transcriptional regulator